LCFLEWVFMKKYQIFDLSTVCDPVDSLRIIC
jgi:hypothetical protein